MIKNEYILKVDLKKKHTAVTPTFVQYDEAVLRFLISDNGKPFFFSGQTSIKTYHRRKDGVVIEGNARVETVKGIQQIVYEYSGNEMYQLGYVDTSLVIYSGDKKVSIQPFKVLIVDSIYDDIATPSNPEYGALQHLIASVEGLVKKVDKAISDVSVAVKETNIAVTEANVARDRANDAAANVQSSISEWKYDRAYDMSISYKKNNVVSYNGSAYIAIRDNKGIAPTSNINDLNWRILASKGEDGEGLVVLHKEDFASALNQTDFVLKNEYDQHQGRVRVVIDGVEQFTPENFVELSSTKIRMNSGLRKDADVKIIYFGNAPAIKNDTQLQIDNINDLLEKFNLAEAQTAIVYATTQGDFAKTQGEYAKSKGDAATIATTQANTAKDSANSAAALANTAATNANTVKDATVTATNKANTATALAESATSNANTATTSAIAAANDANTAKNNANQAAVNANDAVANMSPKGAYSATTNYLPRNIVSYLGSSYMNIVASKGILPTDATKWQPVGSKGDTGSNGSGFYWRNEYNPTTAYTKDDVVSYDNSSFIAIQASNGKIPIGNPSDLYWKLVALRGQDGVVVLKKENHVSGINQSEFTLSSTYDLNQGRVRVVVDGVEQFTPENFIELSTSKIKMREALRQNADVKIIYFGNAPAIKNDLQLQIDNLNSLLESFDIVEKTDYAEAQGDYARQQGDIAATAATNADTKANEAIIATQNAITQTAHAKTQGDYAKNQGEYAKDQREQIEAILNDGAVLSVNGQTGIVTGIETVTNSDTKLATKVDKITGKQLSTEDFTTVEKTKLSGIVTNANNYSHPATHPPSIIVQDASNRFMTDVEKTKLSGIETNANNYAHPANHSPSIITQDANNRFVTDTEKATWNAKETITGSQAKVDAHANRKDNPHQVTASQVGAYTKIEVDNKTGILSELTTTVKTDFVKAINEINAKPSVANYNDLTNKPAIGDVSTLTTTVKTDLVRAINEVNAKPVGTVDYNNLTNKPPIGDVATLTTTDKTSIVKAINEVNAKQGGGNIPDATAFVKGIAKLNNTLGSTAIDAAATSNVVAQVNDKLTSTNVAIGYNSQSLSNNTTAVGNNSKASSHGVAIGTGANGGDLGVAIGANSTAGNYGLGIGFVSIASAQHSVAIQTYGTEINNPKVGVIGNLSGTNNWNLHGDFFVVGTKNFVMPHPKPEKFDTHEIRHAAVESPSAGDNMYRFDVRIIDNEAHVTLYGENNKQILPIEEVSNTYVVSIPLPDYWVHLNINEQVMISPNGHFGNGFGSVDYHAESLIVTLEKLANYNVILFGTRNDHLIQKWNIKGIEREIGESWEGETYIFADDEIIESDEIINEEEYSQ